MCFIGPILLDNVECLGTESSLLECSHLGIGVHNCSDYEIAGVRCTGKNVTSEKGLYKLYIQDLIFGGGVV